MCPLNISGMDFLRIVACFFAVHASSAAVSEVGRRPAASEKIFCENLRK